MAPPSDPHPQTPRLAHACVAFVGWVSRHPWLVLAACLATLGASLYLSATRLQYRTQRDDLLNARKECQQRWHRYVAEFGADEDMVFVVEGADRARMVEAVESAAAALRNRSDLFDRVFWKVDLTGIRDRSLLLMPLAELERVRNEVANMGPLLGPVAPLAWRELGVQGLLDQARAVLAKVRAGGELTGADRGLLERVGPVARAAARAIEDPGRPLSPWGGFLADRPAGDGDLLERSQYFFSADGSLAFLLARPVKADDQSFTPAAEAVRAARTVLADTGKRFPDLTFGLTGLPVLEHDEMAASDEDTELASWLALVGVAVLYLVVYRGFRYPLLTVAALLTGTVWALGLTTVTVGYLTILSSTFAVMLIGMGDYGVLWVARYDEDRQKGYSAAEALRETAAHAGPSIVTAAATTALAFYATMLADFQAVAELGFIAGSGVLLCAVACLTVMPALIAILDRRAGIRPGACAPATLPFRQRWWLPGLARHPVWVVGGSAAVLALSAVLAARLGYDHNLLHMQADGLDSVRWERKLLDKTTGASWHALSTVDSPEEVLALKARYEQLPEVSRVAELASLVPPDQPTKLPLLADLRDRLRWLPLAAQLPEPPAPEPDRLVETIRHLSAEAAEPGSPAGDRVGDALTALGLALAGPSGEVADRLRAFDRRLRTELRGGLEQLRAVCGEGSITLADLPAGLRERFISPSGKWLLRVYAREDLWEYDSLRRFVDKTRAIDPEVTGKPFGTLEGLLSMKSGFLWAGVYALAAIIVVLTLDLRSLGGLGLVLLPLAVGVACTLGFLGLCGLPLNPANLIALPLIVGVGVDNGVHVLHDYRDRDRSGPYRLSRCTGRGILVAALTTLLGFGTLMLSRHQGLFGLGLTLTLGVAFSMVAALVVLPTVLNLLSRRPVTTAPAANRPVAAVRRAAA